MHGRWCDLRKSSDFHGRTCMELRRCSLSVSIAAWCECASGVQWPWGRSDTVCTGEEGATTMQQELFGRRASAAMAAGQRQ